jgi:hypothetical protein
MKRNLPPGHKSRRRRNVLVRIPAEHATASGRVHGEGAEGGGNFSDARYGSRRYEGGRPRATSTGCDKASTVESSLHQREQEAIAVEGARHVIARPSLACRTARLRSAGRAIACSEAPSHALCRAGGAWHTSAAAARLTPATVAQHARQDARTRTLRHRGPSPTGFAPDAGRRPRSRALPRRLRRPDGELGDGCLYVQIDVPRVRAV